MMTSETTFRTAILKQLAHISIIVAAGFLFSTKIIAQDTKILIQQQTSYAQEHQLTPEDVPSFNHDKYSFTKGFSSWVASQTKYPLDALKQKIQGWVHVNYIVELDGTISNVETIVDPDPILGEAVAKAVESSPKWMPAKNEVNASPSKSSVTIRFEIPEKVISSEDFGVFSIEKIQNTEELHRFLDADKMPQFPQAKDATLEATDAAIGKWVAQHLRYPEKAIEENLEGTVIVRFIIMKNGKLEDFTVTKSNCPLLDAEAIRVLSLMPDWKPAMMQGESKNVYYHAAVTFKLPK